VQSPWPTPQLAAGTNKVRSERIFYDGVRRIQELTTDPINDTESAAAQGNEEALETLSEQPSANQSSASASTETSQLRDPGLPSGVSLAREYVWGPGDRGVDELLAQYGPDRSATYILHDAGGDIIALVDKNGAGGTTRLLWEATYDAYGQVIEATTYFAHPPLHAGHKGLFFDRLDSGIVDPNTLNETPRLMRAGHAGSGGGGGGSNARLIGYARNRTLHTGFGRWLQRDPNQSGGPYSSSSSYHGAQISRESPAFDINANYADGANIYEAFRGNSPLNDDPLGLWVWGDEIDTLMVGMEVYGLAETVVDTYGFVLDEGIDWALDWSRGDDEYGTIYAIASSLSSNVDPEVNTIIKGAMLPWQQFAMGVNASKMLSQGAKNARRASRLSTQVQTQFNKWINSADKHGAKYSVYLRRTENGKNNFDYTGLTTDVSQRAKQHGKRLYELTNGLTRNQARCVEQALMVNNPRFFNAGGNINNSISDRRAFREMAVQWGTLHLKKMGKPLRY
jgi:hypothetical protein